MTTVIYLENGLCPQNRQVLQSVSSSVRELAPAWQRPYVAFVDGKPLLRADWGLCPRDDQFVTFIDADAIPQGGSGGGSNPLRTVLMLAVMVYAPQMGGLMGSFAGPTLGIGTMGWTAGFMFAGMALVNAVAPPPKPTSPQQAAALAAPSPTYSLQAQGNTARLDAAIPEHFGRHICYPDFAANPYTEYAGNEQYLYQLLCVGRGSYELGPLMIEDTPITSFEEITTQVVQPYGQLTLFPASVTTSVEVSGQTLSPTVTGPFVANAAGSKVNKLAFDFGTPKGLYYANNDGSLSERTVYITIEIAPIDDYGVVTGSWTILANARPFSAATTTVQRWSWSYDVAPGRYTCKVSRTTAESTETREADSAVWAGLRAYHPDPVEKNYGDVTLIAVKMKATDNLSSQASRKLNLLATRKLPVWNGTSWSATIATRNPAWALAYAAKQVGQTDVTIDLPGLLYLANGCDVRGDHFDARFDSFLSFWEAATKICGSVRSKPYIQGSVLRVARDQAATLPVAMFSQRNIVRGSLSVNYLMPTEDTADSIDVSYFDEITWKTAKVRCTLAGSTAAKPAKVDLFGVVSRAHAWREGLKVAADNRYRRKMITFKTDMEGFIPSFLDLASLQHDMPAWGQSGEVTAWEASTRTLTLSEPVTFSVGTHYIALRDRSGRPRGPYACIMGGDSYHVILDPSPDFTPYTGGAEERTHFAFGPGTAWSQPIRILSAKPTGTNPDKPEVEITAVNEDASVHTADSGVTMPPQQFSQLAGIVNAPAVGVVRAIPTVYSNTLTIDWEPVAWTVNYLVQQSDDSGNTWFDLGSTKSSSWVSPLPYFSTSLIRVAAQGSLAIGPWSTTSILANVSPAPTLPSATAVGGDRAIRVSWLFGDLRQDIFGAEVWVSATNNRAAAVLRATVLYPNQSYEHVGISPGAGGYFWIRIRDTHGGISGWFPESTTGGMYAEAVGEEGVKDLTPPPTPTGFAAAAAISNILVESDAPTYTQGHGHAKSKLYGAPWTGGALPVFADAVPLTEYSGVVASYATDPSTQWHLWLKWVTVDGVESETPAGGTNGVTVTTGEDVTLLVGAMTGAGKPFTVLPVETVIDGVTFPAGTYSTQAFIRDAQITNAKIKNLAVDNAKIADVSAAKLTAGAIAVGQYIEAASFVPGSWGWRINGDGTAEFSGVVVRGTVYATAGEIGGVTVASNAIRAGQTAFDTGSGFFLGAGGTFSIGSSAGKKLTWDGSNLVVKGDITGATGTFSGSITGASGTFAGNLHGGQFTTGAYTGYGWPAAGSYGSYLGPGGLLIGNANDGKYFKVTQDGQIHAPGFSVVNGVMTISQANVINTVNIAGNAVTIPVSASSAAEALFQDVGVTMLSVAITSAGGPIYISATMDITYKQNAGDIQLRRDGTVISLAAANIGAFSLTITDTPGAGTHTYSLNCMPIGISSRRRHIFCLETKR